MTSRLSTSSIRASDWAFLTLFVGCSLFNREGPKTTCAELNNGTQNACSNGIIATCMRGMLTYQVCDSENACEQNWQTPGQYKCDQNAPPPLLIAAGGTSNNTTTTGSGGSASVWSSTGGSSAGGRPTTSSSSTGGAQNSCATGPCAIAATGQSSIDTIAVDDSSVYFSDCTSIWRVAKSGGFPTVLSSQLTGCSYGQMVADGQHVYVQEHNDGRSRVVRITTTGGSREVIVDQTSDSIRPMAVVAGFVFWNNNSLQQISRTNENVGTTDLVAASILDVGPRMLMVNGNLVWCSGSSLSRVSTAVVFPTTPSSVSIGHTCDDLAAAPDGTVAYTNSHDSIVGYVTSTGQTGGESVTGQGGLYAVAVDDTNVYYAAHGSQIEIRKAPRTGGTSTQLAVRPQEITRLIVDKTALYWFEGSSVMKTPK